MLNGLIRAALEMLVEAFLTATGRGLWGLARRKPHDIVATLSGVIFWFVVGLFVYAAVHR